MLVLCWHKPRVGLYRDYLGQMAAFLKDRALAEWKSGVLQTRVVFLI